MFHILALTFLGRNPNGVVEEYPMLIEPVMIKCKRQFIIICELKNGYNYEWVNVNDLNSLKVNVFIEFLLNYTSAVLVV